MKPFNGRTGSFAHGTEQHNVLHLTFSTETIKIRHPWMVYICHWYPSNLFSDFFRRQFFFKNAVQYLATVTTRLAQRERQRDRQTDRERSLFHIPFLIHTKLN
jgi:cytochrome b subunit of formate dehydrogenase